MGTNATALIKPLETLVNVAPSGVAKQSSTSKWSMPQGAQACISGHMPLDYAIHTEKDNGPWWELDLKDAYPLERIVIHNRIDPKFHGRARTLVVQVSVEAKTWTTLHSGLSYFGGGLNGRPMVIELGGQVLGRHLRLSLTEQYALHLAQVEVFVSDEATEIRNIWKTNNYNYAKLFNRLNPTSLAPRYEIISATHKVPRRLIGLKVKRHERLGNNIVQLSNAIHLANLLSLAYVQVDDFPMFHLRRCITSGGLTLLPALDPPPQEGYMLQGDFFFTEVFGAALETKFTTARRYEIIQSFIRPHMEFDQSAAPPTEDELVVHIRSGDLFSGNPHPWYTQPPLSYYTEVVNGLIADKAISRVCVVTEDRGNPCIDALETYLASRQIPFRMQSGSLEADFSFVRQARHLVFGRGTFGFAACLMADRIRSLFVFDGEPYGGIPSIERLTVVKASPGSYIDKWRGTADQLQLMIDYPAKSLVFRGM
jgi:hypothetical protein